MRLLCIAVAGLLVLGCTNGRPVPTDTAAMGELGDLRIGMSRAVAKQIANRNVMYEERITCRSHPGYQYCTRHALSVDSERNVGLLFQNDTLRALSWKRSGDFAALRRRYAHFGEPQRVHSGRSPRPRDVFAEWVSADSTVIRSAVCHDGRSKPLCAIIAASTTPAQVRKGAAEYQRPR
jgi:hypothetical protein